MSNAFFDRLSSQEMKQVNEICDQFESDCDNSSVPDLHQYLARLDENDNDSRSGLRKALFEQLLHSDIRARRELSLIHI